MWVIYISEPHREREFSQEYYATQTTLPDDDDDLNLFDQPFLALCVRVCCGAKIARLLYSKEREEPKKTKNSYLNSSVELAQNVASSSSRVSSPFRSQLFCPCDHFLK